MGEGMGGRAALPNAAILGSGHPGPAIAVRMIPAGFVFAFASGRILRTVSDA
jgi:NCAIR mutase (PurE)-related protein